MSAPTQEPPPERTALYRLYDEHDQLLYVGVTNKPERRWNQHSISKPWWHLVNRQHIQWHPNRREAETAETSAIRNEQPKFNVSQVPCRTLFTGEYDDTADRQRVARLLRRDAARQYFHAGKVVNLHYLAGRYNVSVATLSSVLSQGVGDHLRFGRQTLTILREIRPEQLKGGNRKCHASAYATTMTMPSVVA